MNSPSWSALGETGCSRSSHRGQQPDRRTLAAGTTTRGTIDELAVITCLQEHLAMGVLWDHKTCPFCVEALMSSQMKNAAHALHQSGRGKETPTASEGSKRATAHLEEAPTHHQRIGVCTAKCATAGVCVPGKVAEQMRPAFAGQMLCKSGMVFDFGYERN